MGGGLTKRFVPPHLLNHVQKSPLEILKDDKVCPEMVLLFFLHLKEAVGKSLVRRTEIAYKARLREISWPKATKSNNYHICSSRVDAADIWRERACTLSVEVSQRFH